jgi:hypothetical protein
MMKRYRVIKRYVKTGDYYVIAKGLPLEWAKSTLKDLEAVKHQESDTGFHYVIEEIKKGRKSK